MPVRRFLKYTGRNCPNPVCSFYLPVSISRDTTVGCTMFFEVSFVMPGNPHFVIGPWMTAKHACWCVEQGALAFWTGAATSNRLAVEAENESNKNLRPCDIQHRVSFQNTFPTKFEYDASTQFWVGQLSTLCSINNGI